MLRKIDEKAWNYINVAKLPMEKHPTMLQCLKDKTLYFDLAQIAKKATGKRFRGLIEPFPFFYQECEISFHVVHNKEKPAFGEVRINVDNKSLSIHHPSLLGSTIYANKSELTELLEGETILEILPVKKSA